MTDAGTDTEYGGGTVGDRSGDGARLIPDATIVRLPSYLWALDGLAREGETTVASEELAQRTSVNSATLRKDLSYLGTFGTRGVGYEITKLTQQISEKLKLDEIRRVVIIGAGNLGQALAQYSGFSGHGFQAVGILDSDRARIGDAVGELKVTGMDELEDLIGLFGVEIAVITTPAHVAQDVCDRLTDAGITGVLNFAPCVLQVSEKIDVRNVDLSTELQILAFHGSHRHGAEGTEAGTG